MFNANLFITIAVPSDCESVIAIYRQTGNGRGLETTVLPTRELFCPKGEIVVLKASPYCNIFCVPCGKRNVLTNVVSAYNEYEEQYLVRNFQTPSLLTYVTGWMKTT
jgi:hypothetical protein